MMIFSLVAMIGLEKCCITSACLQWLCHSGERTVARGPLVKFGTNIGYDYLYCVRENKHAHTIPYICPFFFLSNKTVTDVSGPMRASLHILCTPTEE